MDESKPKSSVWQKHFRTFDIDNYLNHVVPRPRLYMLPSPVSHFLGYRRPNTKPHPGIAVPVAWLSSFIGGFIGIALITAVYHALPLLDGRQAPLIIASFGAAAILAYNAIESPLAQPRNLIFGHFLSALTGVSITKLFELLPPTQFDQLRWLSGSISVGVASALMSITKTVHPPAGATALLASTSPDITILGWWLLPLVLLASSLMTASALVVNNVTRRWPVYWWTPIDLSKRADNAPDIEHAKDQEKHSDVKSLRSDGDSLGKGQVMRVEGTDDRSTSDATLQEESEMQEYRNEAYTGREGTILITHNKIVVPSWMEINDWEKDVLETFKMKLVTGD